MSDLEQLLAAAADRPAERPAFYDALMNAQIYVIGRSQNPDGRPGKVVLEAEQKLALEHWSNAEGEAFLPFFTSLEALESTLERESTYLAMNARDLFEATRGATLILNPGARYGKEFFPSEIDGLLAEQSPQRLSQRVVEQDTPVQLGQPAEYPHAMISALSDLFAKEPSVNRAFLALMHDPSRDPEPVLLVGIENVGSFDEISRKAGTVAGETAPKDKPVDLTPVVEGAAGLNDYFINETQPFYERKKRGLFRSLFGTGRA
jgi:hypothetical protein